MRLTIIAGLILGTSLATCTWAKWPSAVKISMPFGVLKKFLSLRSMPKPSRFAPLQLRREDQPFHTHAIQKLNPRFRPEHQCRRRQRIRESHHCGVQHAPCRSEWIVRLQHHRKLGHVEASDRDQRSGPKLRSMGLGMAESVPG